MKTILILSATFILICTALFVHQGETTLWVSDRTIQDYIDGKASVTVLCGLPAK